MRAVAHTALSPKDAAMDSECSRRISWRSEAIAGRHHPWHPVSWIDRSAPDLKWPWRSDARDAARRAGCCATARGIATERIA